MSFFNKALFIDSNGFFLIQVEIMGLWLTYNSIPYGYFYKNSKASTSLTLFNSNLTSITLDKEEVLIYKNPSSLYIQLEEDNSYINWF